LGKNKIPSVKARFRSKSDENIKISGGPFGHLGDIIGKSGDLFGKRQEKDSLGKSTSQYRQSFFRTIEKLGLSNAIYGYLPFAHKISRSQKITSKPLPNETLQRSTT
jgi:hypothetical protein